MTFLDDELRKLLRESGSSLASSASLRSRAICAALARGIGGRQIVGPPYTQPTAWVHLNRSASSE